MDSEFLAKQIANNGYKVVFGSDCDANIVIINTCGFIADAKKEAIDTILVNVEAKKAGKIDKLFVVGCLSARYADILRKEIPEVDEYFGISSIEEVLRSIGGTYSSILHNERIVSTPSHYAYVKISDGCDRHCAFCAIPSIKGRYISTPIEALVAQAHALARLGVKELILVAQDLTNYGLDIYNRRSVIELIDALSAISGIEWIRMHYLYPDFYILKAADAIKDNPKVCKYFDIPIQHINDGILQGMRRYFSQKDIINLIDGIRNRIQNAAIRTTLIVGFPNEDEKSFNELLNFVKSIHFERLGVFMYSKEENTYAAEHYLDNVSHKIKQNRMHKIMSLQKEIAAEYNKSMIGSTIRVIIDSRDNDFWIARSQFDSPQIDGHVLIPTEHSLTIGDFYDVHIIGSYEYDMIANIAK